MILNDSIVIFVLGFLILAVAFNLWLSFRLIRAIRFLPMSRDATPQKLEEGGVISDFSADRLTGKTSTTLNEYPEYAKVLIFLTSKCNKCKSKLPELLASMEKSKEMGVLIWILTVESNGRMKNFLENEVLLGATMRVNQTSYDYLNPEGASPYYLFIDAENTLQAQGFIGDENWVGFVDQLNGGN